MNINELIELSKLEYFGNTLMQYASFLAVFLVFVFVFFVFKRVVLRKAAKLAEGKEKGELILGIANRIKPAFYVFLSFYIALQALTVPELLNKIIFVALGAWIAIRLVVSLQQITDFVAEKYILQREERERASMGIIVRVVKAMLWLFVGLIFLSTMGVNITALIAGLGVGGIAIGFALQNILGDLFSSFAIFFDKPFVEGDFIMVGDKMGTVEKIGIKTTRLRALQGEEIVISNRELTSVQIHNFKKVQSRRGGFSFGVTYDTPSEKLEKIPGMVEEIVKEEELADFDRVHFSRFDDSALNFDVVYYVKSSDFVEYMDVQQSILFKIKREFEKEGISMAFPTRTVYLNK